MKNELKVFLAITAESPKHYWNTWEANGSDLAYALEMAEIPFDEQIIPWEESEIFYDFHDLEGTEIQTIKSFNEITFRQFIEFMDDACIHIGGICDTMGIMDSFGIIPAKAIETDSFCNSWVSIYVCPMYGDEIPSKESFDRFFTLLEKYDSWEMMRMMETNKRYEQTETNQMEE